MSQLFKYHYLLPRKLYFPNPFWIHSVSPVSLLFSTFALFIFFFPIIISTNFNHFHLKFIGFLVNEENSEHSAYYKQCKSASNANVDKPQYSTVEQGWQQSATARSPTLTLNTSHAAASSDPQRPQPGSNSSDNTAQQQYLLLFIQVYKIMQRWSWSVFCRILYSLSALTLLVGHQEEHLACLPRLSQKN